MIKIICPKALILVQDFKKHCIYVFTIAKLILKRNYFNYRVKGGA